MHISIDYRVVIFLHCHISQDKQCPMRLVFVFSKTFCNPPLFTSKSLLFDKRNDILCTLQRQRKNKHVCRFSSPLALTLIYGF